MLFILCMLRPASMSPPSASLHPALCRRNMEEVFSKYLLMLWLCMYVLLPCWTVCSPKPEACPALCCSLCPGIQYRPGFNNGRLISGPRTKILAPGQEASLYGSWGCSHIFWSPLVILCSDQLLAAPGEKPVCTAVVHHKPPIWYSWANSSPHFSSPHPLPAPCCCSDGSG